ncbi:MAG: hypothetical protein H8E78_08490 [Proteobacteria bacterium]|nr:hypothetical protein [Pseudomonadota bacterium]
MLDFASEIFARVAILIVREEQVFAIASRGIDALEVVLQHAGLTLDRAAPE